MMRADNDPLARFSPLELSELVGYADAAHCPHCAARAESSIQRRIAVQRTARAERRRVLVSRALAATADSRQFLAAWLAARSSLRELVSW